MLWPLPLTNNLQRVCISLLWKYDYRKVLKLIRAYQDADNTDSKDTMLEDVKLIANVIKTAPTSDTKHFAQLYNTRRHEKALQIHKISSIMVHTG